MLTAGIDSGVRTVKVVLWRDGALAAHAMALGGADSPAVARELLVTALGDAGLTRRDVAAILATGAGRQTVPDKNGTRTDVSSAARGAVELMPRAGTVVDVGAEETRAIRCDERGKVLDFAINDKCAAGAGVFLETMARALEVPLERLGPLSLESTQAIAMHAQCAVFAESEVVSMIHHNVSRSDVARAIHDAIAGRIVALMHKVRWVPPVVLVGGAARNVGLVDALRRGLETHDLHIPGEPEFCCALGAALAATD